MEVFPYFWDSFFYPMNHPNSFPKKEHLCGEKRINALFSSGHAFVVYPFRVVYILEPANNNETAIVIMVSVPKKRFKRAVKRNRLKRLMREAYRLNKQELISILESELSLLKVSFQYISDEELDFETVEKKMKVALQKLIDKVQNN